MKRKSSQLARTAIYFASGHPLCSDGRVVGAPQRAEGVAPYTESKENKVQSPIVQ